MVLKFFVVVEDGINIGGDKVSELVFSYRSFGGYIDDKLEGVKTVYVIKDGKRYSNGFG